MRTILFITLTILSGHAFGQLNIDSLYNTMKNTTPKEVIEKFGFKQKTFYSESENTTYEFTLDKNGKLTENNWGICLSTAKLDVMGRSIENRSYARKGNLFASLSPPIIRTNYIDSEYMEEIDFYNADFSLVKRIEVQYDSIGREIALIGYDEDLKLRSKQTTEYLDSENASIKKFYDSNNELGKNDCGVSIWYLRTDKQYGFEVERKYFDKDLNLVDCTHEDPEVVYAYNRATQVGKNEWEMIYYTKKGEIVREFLFKREE